MCGIVGYIGNKRAVPILTSGLKRLEYRGYDSSGVAVINQAKKIGDVLVVHKDKGKISDMLASMPQEVKASNSTIGISHTRWATHGEPSQMNAHPHVDGSGKIAVVHNGIIENYSELKEKLSKMDHQFVSETDTEVIPHLIQQYMKDQDLLSAVKQALRTVRGTYGLLIMHSDYPDRLIAARNSSPLLIGVGFDEMIVASDLTAIAAFTQQVIYLADGEVSVLQKDDIDTSDLNDVYIKKSVEKIYLQLQEIEKGKYSHYMLKEIHEQQESIERVYMGRTVHEDGTAQLSGLNFDRTEFFNTQRLCIIGCGTAMHAGLVSKYFFEEMARIPCDVEIASEYRQKKLMIDEKTLYLAISQSGETADTLAALREIKRKEGRVAAISNVVGSSIARECGRGVYIHAGPEIAVASTKAFTSQITALFLFSLFIARKRDMSEDLGKKLVAELTEIPKKVEEILNNAQQIERLAEKYVNLNNFLFLGRHVSYPIAMEGALKLKEISYIHAEAYAAGEMKHGAIALVDEHMGVVFVAPHDEVYSRTISNIEEIKARKGNIIVITNKGDSQIEQLANDVIYIPKTDRMLSPLLMVIPLQLFAYYMAIKRGCDVDQPRNLAKSVTVE
jgi:glucosamine--fructose-6-phosphate aminotransferase (isomerizing)